MADEEKVVKEMTDEEKAECETVTQEMHADARDLLAFKPKVWNFPPLKPPEPETNIWTPNGEYSTTVKLAQELEEWLTRHKLPLDRQGAIGGQFNYIFTSTSMGVNLIVEDCVTNHKINVTNYNNW